MGENKNIKDLEKRYLKGEKHKELSFFYLLKRRVLVIFNIVAVQVPCFWSDPRAGTAGIRSRKACETALDKSRTAWSG